MFAKSRRETRDEGRQEFRSEMGDAGTGPVLLWGMLVVLSRYLPDSLVQRWHWSGTTLVVYCCTARTTMMLN